MALKVTKGQISVRIKWVVSGYKSHEIYRNTYKYLSITTEYTGTVGTLVQLYQCTYCTSVPTVPMYPVYLLYQSTYFYGVTSVPVYLLYQCTQ